MPVYHRTQRLQIFGEKPEIQKLYGSRYRMVVRCVAKNDTKAWYDDNKSQIFADFGSLYSAQMSVDGIDARTGEAYDDMVLVKNEATYTRSGEYVIIFTYETLTDSFVQETEDKVDFDLNGLKRLTRTIIAKDATSYASVVGTTTIVNSSPLLTLAQVSEDQLEASEDGFKRIQEVWLESGTLSETLDNVGSQKAKVIETIGADPATPTGYSLASKQESDFEGFQTNRFTFLKDNVELSRSEDKVGSQLAITTQVFNPTSDPTESGYSLARKEVSDVDGIPTKRYTFLKDNVQLSQTEDKVGSQLAISQQWFNPNADKTLAGYSLASKNTSDFEGIETVEYRFLKNNVELSRSEDLVGSQLAITTEVFNPTSDPTESGYSLAREEVSDVEGIPTKRYTFLKEDVKLSASEDEVGSQNAITEQWFKPNGSRGTKTGYSLARKEESDVGGIPTERYTFLKDDVELSRSSDLVGSQKAIVTEVFKPSADPTETGYSVARTEVSDVDGIPTKRFTFLKDNVELSRSSDLVGSQKAITTEVFKPTSDPTESGYSVARAEVSDVEGIPTKRFTFLKDNVVLSVSEDKVGSQKAVVNEVFNPTSEAITGIDTSGTALVGYSEANRTESDYEGIKTIRVQFLKPSILSLQQDFNNGLKRVSVQAFGMTDADVSAELAAITTSHELMSQTESDYEGIKTSTFQYQIDESFTEDYELNGLKRISLIELGTTNFSAISIGSQGTTATPQFGLYLATQDIDNGGIIKVRESTWLEAGTLRESSRNLAEGVVEVTTTFLVTEDAVVGPITSKTIDNFEGLKTITFTTMQDGSGASVIADSDSGEKLANSYEQLTSFTYPGIADVEYRAINGTGADYRSYQWSLDPPAQALIESETFVFFQTSDEIAATDYTYDGAIKLWNPNQWAYGSAYGIGFGYLPFAQSKGFRGYRAKYVYDLSFTEGGGPSGPNYLINGSRIFANNGCGISLAGGPEDPVNKKYTLEVKITPAFEDISGVTYYKKVISVATIPAQTSGAVAPPTPDP